MANQGKQYMVAGIVVEAVKSEGGGFYDVTVLLTGVKMRVLADVFEEIAVSYNGPTDTTEVPQ